MFKTETHLHTSETSSCGKLTAEEMVALYNKAGYSTLFVTDHCADWYFDKIADLTWEEKVHWQFGGYRAAKSAAEKYGITVIMGLEMSLKGTNNHYLLYGLDESFLLEKENINSLTPQELYAYAKAKGVTVVQAHPLRDNQCVPTFDCVDAVEALNGNPRHENYTEQTLALAKKADLPITSGSDAHRAEDVALGGVITKEKITCANDYVSALFSGNLQLIGNNV